MAWHPHVLVLGIDANWIPAQMPRQSASALSARHGHIEQRASYSLWVARAGCHTFLNVFQCSNDKRKRAVRIWVVIAGNSTMLAMLASMYFMRVDCKDGRPKKDSMGNIAKGNLWPFEFVTAQEFLKSPSNNMLKLSCSLEAGRRCAPMWRRNHSWIVTWIKCRFFCLCPNAYNTQLQMRDRNLMKPTAYQYEHSKFKPKYQVDWQTCQVQSDKPCFFAHRGAQIKLSKTIEENEARYCLLTSPAFDSHLHPKNSVWRELSYQPLEATSNSLEVECFHGLRLSVEDAFTKRQPQMTTEEPICISIKKHLQHWNPQKTLAFSTHLSSAATWLFESQAFQAAKHTIAKERKQAWHFYAALIRSKHGPTEIE